MNAYSLSRLFIAWLTCLATLLFAPLLPAVEAEKNAAGSNRKTTRYRFISTICYGHGEAICTGMIDRRTIRVLTTYSKTFFLLIKAPSAGRRTTFLSRWKTS